MIGRTLIAQILLIATLLLVAANPIRADDDDRHRRDDDEHYTLGVRYGYRPPYWGPYRPGYPYYHPGYYRPPYGPYLPPYGGSIGFGYGSGYHGDAFSLFFSVPLWFGPRYAPAPPPTMLVPSVKGGTQALPPDCLQLREYQTEIVIGGEKVPAYGTACLQADGSWRIVSGPFAEQ